jgi:glutathione S-transferase
VLSESTAILQYLATTRELQDPWYPADPRSMSLVHRFNSWYHPNLRANAALMIFKTHLESSQGLDLPSEELKEMKANVPNLLKTMDRWIEENGGFIAGG